MRMNRAARLTGSSSPSAARKVLSYSSLRPARDVAALPLVLLGGDLPGGELVHERLGIGLRHGRRVHLDVAVELRVGVGIGDVGGEEHRCRDRLELHVDAGLLAGLLDDRLVLLPRRIDGRLEDELELLAVLGPDAVGPLLPAGSLQDLVRLLDVELPLRVLRAEALGVVEEVAGGDAGAAVDAGPPPTCDRPACPSACRTAGIGQQRMLGLEAGRARRRPRSRDRCC